MIKQKKSMHEIDLFWYFTVRQVAIYMYEITYSSVGPRRQPIQ